MDESTEIQTVAHASVVPARPAGALADPALVGRPRVDHCAIASAVCGLTAFIPIVSQVAGIVLGVMALVRIRRARRAGLNVAGIGWATAGIASSAGLLLCWIFVIVMFGVVVSIFSKVGEAIPAPAP